VGEHRIVAPRCRKPKPRVASCRSSAWTSSTIPWEELTPEAQAIARQLGLPLSLGFSLREAARRIEISVSSAGFLLDLLADERLGCQP
jgi:hypothetical protein